MNRRRGFKAQIPEEDFQAGPQGLKYYDMTPGKGALPKKGDRIAVHYEIRWHGVTFMTSRCLGPNDVVSLLLGVDCPARHTHLPYTIVAGLKCL